MFRIHSFLSPRSAGASAWSGYHGLLRLFVHLIETDRESTEEAQDLQSRGYIHVAAALHVAAACILLLLFTQVL